MKSILMPWRRPDTNDRDAWRAYWKLRGQLWRTEPEIDLKRQKYLGKLLAIKSDEELDLFPFNGIHLNRADLEWLLAVHNKHKSVDQNDELLRMQNSLDLRFVDLHEENLSNLPLKEIKLNKAHLAGVDLWRANLEGAFLNGAYLEGAELNEAHLEGAELIRTHLEGASLWMTYLEGAVLNSAYLEDAELIEAHLEKAYLTQAHLERAKLIEAHLEGANLAQAHLEGASLWMAHLEKATFSQAHLEQAELVEAHLEGTDLTFAYLEGADLRRAFFDSGTKLEGAELGDEKIGFVSLAGAHWRDVDLSVVDWRYVKILGDERLARQKKIPKKKKKDSALQIDEYRMASRANRQLSIALQDQGLDEEAVYFAYRAQQLQRVVLRKQKRFGQYLFSLFLDFIAGYGYQPIRSLIAYVVIIIGFMGLYLLNAHFVVPHIRWDEALVLSLSSFHGRGFFSQNITLGDTYARIAVIEAVIGLLIEISLIASFTRRFFGK